MVMAQPATVPLRDPNELMKIERLGALQPNDLSFSRSLMRKMIRERWRIEIEKFEIDERARGDALYRIDTGGMILSFIVFSMEPIYDELRTGRIIGRRWDMFGALIEGEATPDKIEITRKEWEKLYAGRAPAGTLIWCRSNRSGRVFNHVVDQLAAGRPLDVGMMARIGYIMRNTGLDGNGTFGTKSYLAYEEDHPLRIPYHAQMLAAYMMREFAADLTEHLARHRSPTAAKIDPDLRRFLGIGNGSALGLGFWIVNHPIWTNRWLELREMALANAKSKELAPDADDIARFLNLLGRAIMFRAQDRIEYSRFTPSNQVADDLRSVRALVEEYKTRGTIGGQPTTRPWLALCERFPDGISLEAEETVHALLIDTYSDYADALGHQHRVPEIFKCEPAMPVARLLKILEDEWRWALDIDMNSADARYYTWYKSQEAEEPRRGPRHEVEESYELALDFSGEVQSLARIIRAMDPESSVGELLRLHPGKRLFVERVQSLRGTGYHTPHINMLDKEFIPVYLPRLVNVPFFGIDKTRDGKNGVRGLLFHGAPTAADLAAGWEGEWQYPEEPAQ